MFTFIPKGFSEPTSALDFIIRDKFPQSQFTVVVAGVSKVQPGGQLWPLFTFPAAQRLYHKLFSVTFYVHFSKII